MHNSGNWMLRKSSNARCKKHVRNKRKLKIQWPCLTGRDRLVRFRGFKSRKELRRSVTCLKTNGRLKRRGRIKLNNRNSCSIARGI